MSHKDQNTNLETLKKIVHQFVAERDWQKFHSPKNIASKISTEAAELLEKFVWLDSNKDSFEEVNKNRQEIEDETADIFFLLLSFCNVADIDLTSALLSKIKEIGEKYPIEKSKGICTKYDKL